MIKAVFFDWWNTLMRPDPPRHELYGRAFRECGIELSPKIIMRGILVTERRFYEGNAKLPSNAQEQNDVYTYFAKEILAGAGIEVSQDLPLKIAQMVLKQNRGTILFDDVLPNLKLLKEQGLILGLLTNSVRSASEMNLMLRKHTSESQTASSASYGLEPYFDLILSSGELGFSKPDPRFFLASLKRARVKPSESIYIGDQYEIDIEGSRRAGITPILIDRFGFYPEVSDCLRICNLADIAKYLKEVNLD